MAPQIEEVMYRSGFENSMSIIVAMRGPLDFRFKGKWYWGPYLSYTIFLETVTFINFITVGVRFFSPGVDVIERCFTCFPITSITLSISRVSYLFLRRARFARLIMEYDSLYKGSEKLEQEVTENAKILRFIPRLMVFLTALPMGPWCFMPILNALRGEAWSVTVPSTWPFDPLSNVYTFVLVSILQTVCAALSTLRVVLFDNIFSVYACRQLALSRQLSRELGRILSVAALDAEGRPYFRGPKGQRLDKGAASAYARQEMRQWIINHQKSLWLARELQTLFSPCLAFQFAMISISCCTTAFVVVFSNADLLNITLCFFYAIGNSLELLITCRIGDLITNQSDKLEETTSGSHFYTLEEDIYRVWLKVILTRAYQPIRLSAFGVFPLNTETFKNIMVTTYSFFTLLMSMKERQERDVTSI